MNNNVIIRWQHGWLERIKMIIEDGRVLPHFLILENQPRGIISFFGIKNEVGWLQLDGFWSTRDSCDRGYSSISYSRTITHLQFRRYSFNCLVKKSIGRSYYKTNFIDYVINVFLGSGTARSSVVSTGNSLFSTSLDSTCSRKRSLHPDFHSNSLPDA